MLLERLGPVAGEKTGEITSLRRGGNAGSLTTHFNALAWQCTWSGQIGLYDNGKAFTRKSKDGVLSDDQREDIKKKKK